MIKETWAWWRSKEEVLKLGHPSRRERGKRRRFVALDIVFPNI
jgi:hypothetical protein